MTNEQTDNRPERIWISEGQDGDAWTGRKEYEDDTEYVRADIHRAEVERLEKKISEHHCFRCLLDALDNTLGDKLNQPTLTHTCWRKAPTPKPQEPLERGEG